MTNQSTQLNLPIPEDISDEDVDISVPEEKRKINAIPSDQEIHSIVHKWQNGILILQPDFQRYYVWDEKKASRLIESALLSVPLPLIYLSEDPNGNLSVIDGQQRLHTFISFIHGKYIHNNKPFVLKDLRVFKELNGLSFKNIPTVYQNRLRYFTLRVITIKSDSDPRLKHEIFERLNTGAVALNNMELRNCLNQGRFLTLLKELSAYTPFRELLGLQDADPRMRDVELVLRFAAFYHHGYTGYSSPMKKFLNDEMETYQNITEQDAVALKKKFKTTVTIIKSLFGENAFHRYVAGKVGSIDGNWESKTFNAALYDVYMNVFSNKDRNQVQKSADLIRESIIDLMSNNQDFIDAILLATSNTDRVKKRFSLMYQLIDNILAKKPKQVRLFSYEIKKQLFDANPVCEICSQQIFSIDDAAVDHIEQYWKGGQTTVDNARLTHRFCNNSRPRKDA